MTVPHAPHAPAPGQSGARRPIRKIRSHGQTDQGRLRKSNEDQFLVARLTQALQVPQTSVPREEVQCGNPHGHLFVVADGVGGNTAGEHASALAVNTVANFVRDTLNGCNQAGEGEGERVLLEFQRALKHADACIFHEVGQRPELRGMATTLTLAYCLCNDLFIAHAGDSRCYLMRKNLLYRLTRDHTLVAEMVRRGFLDPEEAAKHNLRHVVTNVVGGSDPGVQVEVHKMPLEVGDRLLLCSDGLTEMVPEAEILNILHAEADPEAACQRLIARANERGGKDNITVVVAHFEG